jgi:hypothetical protein
MSVYAIAQLWIHDPVKYGRYVDRFMEVFKNYKGRVLAADESPLTIEGAWDGDKVVLISFPDEACEGPEGGSEVSYRFGERNHEPLRGCEDMTIHRGPSNS